MRIRKFPRQGDDVVSYRNEGGIPILPLTIGSTTLDARIDTGNSIGAFVLPTALAERLSFISEAATVGRARSLSFDQRNRRPRLLQKDAGQE